MASYDGDWETEATIGRARQGASRPFNRETQGPPKLMRITLYTWKPTRCAGLSNPAGGNLRAERMTTKTELVYCERHSEEFPGLGHNATTEDAAHTLTHAKREYVREAVSYRAGLFCDISQVQSDDAVIEEVIAAAGESSSAWGLAQRNVDESLGRFPDRRAAACQLRPRDWKQKY